MSCVNSDDLKSRAQALRAAGNTPKQIARVLGIPRSKAVSLMHSGDSPRPDRGTSPEKPLIGCWVTRAVEQRLDHRGPATGLDRR